MVKNTKIIPMANSPSSNNDESIKLTINRPVIHDVLKGVSFMMERWDDVTFRMSLTSIRMLVAMIIVNGILINSLPMCHSSSASLTLDLIQTGYSGTKVTGINGLICTAVQVKSIKVTINAYKIIQDEQIEQNLRIYFSEGIGPPSKAALTFICLKEN